MSSNEYEVEAIIGKRVEKKTTYYKVRWLGYDDSEATWEKASNLSCDDLIQDFEKNGVKPPFVVRNIIEYKYDHGDKEMEYTCLDREGKIKVIPSHLLKIKNKQIMIDFLQSQVHCEEREPTKKAVSHKKKSE
ncbi:hypothetical protein M9Y10_022059 [Tritrichomonas musculus]|uniref:Chromo domain-containing protein n=1 Tax=Tritrichomonas musculus TaxID=1915356 RepID=A0ABR2KR66_9EUKA